MFPANTAPKSPPPRIYRIQCPENGSESNSDFGKVITPFPAHTGNWRKYADQTPGRATEHRARQSQVTAVLASPARGAKQALIRGFPLENEIRAGHVIGQIDENLHLGHAVAVQISLDNVVVATAKGEIAQLARAVRTRSGKGNIADDDIFVGFILFDI